MSNQRKLVLIFMLLALATFMYLLIEYTELHFGIVVLLSFFGSIGVLYFYHFEEPNNFFRYYPNHRKIGNYNKSLLFLYAKILEIDGMVTERELLIVKRVLKKDLESFYLKEHFEFLKSSFRVEANIKHPLRDIMDNFGSEHRSIFVNNLIRLAAADRYLSTKEETFILEVAKELRMGKRAINALFGLHNFIREKEINRDSKMTVTKNSAITTAFQVLGIESNSSMEEVKESYRELAKIYHPDKVRNANLKKQAKVQFQAITEAYELIKNKN